jgi:hypothetical protein
MNWLFSRALVEEYLGGTSLDGEPSVQSSGNHMQLAYLPLDKMTDFSRLSRFGMTFRPLTVDRGKELLMSYLAGFHAKTSQRPGRALELKESAAECGEKWRGSFTKYNQDLHLWKTHQCSLLGGLDEFLETWPQWGLMRDGECWEQQTLEQTIRGTGCGLLPDGVKTFHTPNTTGLDGGSNSRRALARRAGGFLQSSDAMFPMNATVLDVKGTANAKWPAPTAHNAKETNAPSEQNRNTPILAAQVGGKLNPTWVEWLMGWPLGWTDLKPLETDKFQQWQQQHSNF